MISGLSDKLICSRLSCLKLSSIRVKVIRASVLKGVTTGRAKAEETMAAPGEIMKKEKEKKAAEGGGGGGRWLEDMLVDEIVEGDEVYLSISRYLVKDNLSFYDKPIMDQAFDSWMGTSSMDEAPEWWRNPPSTGGGLH